MAPSTLDRTSSTPPPAAPRGRTKRPTAKVLEAQKTLQSRTTTLRAVQSRASAGAAQLPQNKGSSNTQQPAHNELPPFPSERESIQPEDGGRISQVNEVAQLIASLREIIAQQNSIITSQSSTIESIRADLVAIKEEQ
jgi:hypothetical protein